MKLQSPVPEVHPPCAAVMTIAGATTPVVTSVIVIAYVTAPGTALKVNVGLFGFPLPVGLIAVGAVGMTAAAVVLALVFDSGEVPALLIVWIPYTYAVFAATEVSA